MRLEGWSEGYRIGLAGGAAALAYLGMMLLDMRRLGYRQNDLVLQGRLVPSVGRWWLPTGLVLHGGFGLLLAALYARFGRRLPGPGWLRGLLFASAENWLLWPLTLLIDRYHPAVLDGQMPPLNNLRCFAQAELRHLAFGVVLGLVDGRLGRRGEG
jgi:hypothetical protein